LLSPLSPASLSSRSPVPLLHAHATRAHASPVPAAPRRARPTDPPPPLRSANTPSPPPPPSPQPEAPLKLSGTSASIATLVWQIAAKEKVLEKVQDELFQMVECFATMPELRHVALDPFVPTSTKVKLLESVFKGSGEITEVTKRLFASLAAENCLAATLQARPVYGLLFLFVGGSSPGRYAGSLLPLAAGLQRPPPQPSLPRNLTNRPSTTRPPKPTHPKPQNPHAQVANAYEELQLAHKKEVHCTIITAARLDKLEKAEMRKRAEAFVEPGFKLVMKERMDRRLLGGFVLEFEDRRVDMSVAKKLEEFNGLVFKLEADLRA
jgi:F0F1-type ATP synthase delta subunit